MLFCLGSPVVKIQVETVNPKQAPVRQSSLTSWWPQCWQSTSLSLKEGEHAASWYNYSSGWQALVETPDAQNRVWEKYLCLNRFLQELQENAEHGVYRDINSHLCSSAHGPILTLLPRSFRHCRQRRRKAVSRSLNHHATIYTLLGNLPCCLMQLQAGHSKPGPLPHYILFQFYLFLRHLCFGLGAPCLQAGASQGSSQVTALDGARIHLWDSGTQRGPHRDRKEWPSELKRAC